MPFVLRVALRTDVFAQLFHHETDVMAADSTVGIIETVTRFPVDIISVPLAGHQRVTDGFGKFGKSPFQLFLVVQVMRSKPPEVPASKLSFFCQLSFAPTLFYGFFSTSSYTEVGVRPLPKCESRQTSNNLMPFTFCTNSLSFFCASVIS